MGSLGFDDFANLNSQLGLSIHRKDLQRIFNILDKQRTKRVRMDDIKSVASLVANDETDPVLQDAAEPNVEGLSGETLLS